MESTDNEIEIFTIGFTKKGAREFFRLLESAGIKRLLDVRIRNRSQLSGFAKRDDLIFFLDELLNIEYQHNTALAPTEELLDEWRDDVISWQEYEEQFEQLLIEREIEHELEQECFTEPTVLLCSEHDPEYCHRRLVGEYLSRKWGGVKQIHLKQT